ncbi:MAG: Rv1733c family protein [Actinomycetes bacterium]
MPAARPPRRAMERLGFDGNPLRRTTDWLQSATTVALLALFVLVAPVLGMLAGQAAYAKGSAAEQVQRGDRHAVQAKIVKSASTSVTNPDGAPLQSSAWVRWRGPDGARHEGRARVSPGADVGSKVTVWIDEDGRLVTAPLTHAQVVSNAVSAGLIVVVGTGGVLVLVWFVVRRRLERSRMDDWDADWAIVSQKWMDQI